ncbi:MAG: hypothetical protein ACRETY_11905, partial [Steroidobacteraceae bacterium]
RYGGLFDGAIVSQRRGEAPRSLASRRNVLSARKRLFWPDYVAPHELAGSKGGWLSCFAAISGARYKILNAR